MWDEDPKWQQGNWRTVVGMLKASVAFAGALCLVFGTWEPLGALLSAVGAVVACHFLVWVGPVWLSGKLVTSLSRWFRASSREKSLKPPAA